MSRFSLVSGLLLFLGAVVSPCSAAVTYEIVDGAAGGQGDYTLTGTITFDSACGTSCTNADILKYSLAYENGSSGTIAYDQAADGVIASGFFGISGDASVLNVTATGISFDFAEKAGSNQFVLGNGGSSAPFLAWRQGTDLTEEYALGTSLFPAENAFQNLTPSGNPTIFTAVPEPSSFLALGLIGVVFGGRTYFARGRKLVG